MKLLARKRREKRDREGPPEAAPEEAPELRALSRGRYEQLRNRPSSHSLGAESLVEASAESANDGPEATEPERVARPSRPSLTPARCDASNPAAPPWLRQASAASERLRSSSDNAVAPSPPGGDVDSLPGAATVVPSSEPSVPTPAPSVLSTFGAPRASAADVHSAALPPSPVRVLDERSGASFEPSHPQPKEQPPAPNASAATSASVAPDHLSASKPPALPAAAAAPRVEDETSPARRRSGKPGSTHCASSSASRPAPPSTSADAGEVYSAQFKALEKAEVCARGVASARGLCGGPARR